MKIHNPVGNCYHFRFWAWHRRDMTHWRDNNAWTAALNRRLRKAFAAHLQRGGTVVECFTDPRCNSHWKLGDNCFRAPYKNDPHHIADHVANRVIGFGWRVQLI